MYLPSGSAKITIFSANARGGFRNLLQSQRSCPVLLECTKEWVKWRLCQASFVIIVLFATIHICQPTYSLCRSAKIRIYFCCHLLHWWQRCDQDRHCAITPVTVLESYGDLWAQYVTYRRSAHTLRVHQPYVLLRLQLSVGKDSADFTTLEDSTNALVLLIKMYFLEYFRMFFF